MKIRHRIMMWVVGAGLLTSFVFSLIIYWELHDSHLDMMDSQLKASAAVVEAKLAQAQKQAGGQDIGLPVFFNHYWIKVYDQNMRAVYHSPLSKAADLPLKKNDPEDSYIVTASIAGTPPADIQAKGNEITFLVRTIPEIIMNRPYVIQIAEPVANPKGETLELLAAIGIGLSVSTVLLISLSYMLAGRIVKPIAAINRLARDINEHTLETRIPLGRSRDEIYELAARLNQMFDRLQYSFDRQKRLLADASHELKSPIAILKLFFEETAQRQDLPETFRQQVDAQCRNIFRMDRLVRTLLELSVLEISPKATLKPLDAAELTRSVLSDFSPAIQRADIQLTTRIPKQVIVPGDSDKIRRVLINTIDNAIKYNAEGGQMAIQMTEKRGRMELSITNTGPGIPKVDLPRVFDQFYRVDKSRSTERGGAGLGLSIVREIIRLHRGRVDIESEEGCWTRIEIALPK